MNLTTKFLLAGAAFAAMAVPAYAAKDRTDAEAGAKAESGMQRHSQNDGERQARHGMLTTFDTDGDGRVTQAEIDDFRSGRLAKFDTDGNGSLTLSEYEALWLAAMREKMVDRFQDLDADDDGVVTAEEFKRPYATLARHMGRANDDDMSGAQEETEEQKQE